MSFRPALTRAWVLARRRGSPGRGRHQGTNPTGVPHATRNRRVPAPPQPRGGKRVSRDTTPDWRRPHLRYVGSRPLALLALLAVRSAGALSPADYDSSGSPSATGILWRGAHARDAERSDGSQHERPVPGRRRRGLEPCCRRFPAIRVEAPSRVDAGAEHGRRGSTARTSRACSRSRAGKRSDRPVPGSSLAGELVAADAVVVPPRLHAFGRLRLPQPHRQVRYLSVDFANRRVDVREVFAPLCDVGRLPAALEQRPDLSPRQRGADRCVRGHQVMRPVLLGACAVWRKWSDAASGRGGRQPRGGSRVLSAALDREPTAGRRRSPAAIV